MAGNRRRRVECLSTARVTTTLLLSFLALSPSAAFAQASRNTPQIPILPPRIPVPNSDSLRGEHVFTLRHVFHRGTHLYPTVHRRLDVPPNTPISIAGSEDGEAETFSHLHARSRGLQIQRLADRQPSTIEDYLTSARHTGEAVTLSSSAWTLDEVSGPNITDKETVLNLAIITGNDYVEVPGSSAEWHDISGPFNYSQSFGWEGDSLRGHIYADESNRTIILSIKGTSPAVFDGSGTTTNDKENDNLFFSCCCGQGGNYFWRQVCDCYQTTYTCNKTCLVKALRQPNRYYQASIDLYTNVTALYPNSNIWLAGHSLGGATASLLGMTFGLPVVTFEGVPEALPAARLGLPVPPGYDPKAQQRREFTGAYHFGHTADPIYMGTCNGATAVCTLGGYAMESQCHTGHRCVYDTVGDKGWRVGAGTHSIQNVIKDVIMPYNTTPACERDTECVDCYPWKFPESNGTESSSSSSSTSTSTTKTRTTTCKTPGWWGCLDETTTTTTSSSTSSTSSTPTSSTTCHTPGWFGCNDSTSTTTSDADTPTPSSSKAVHTPAPTMTTTRSLSSTSSHSRSPSTRTTCETPGHFWGCYDHSTTTSPASSISSISSPTPTPSRPHKNQNCTSRAWFGLICVDPSPIQPSSVVTPSPTSEPPHRRRRHCLKRSWWFGRCAVWGLDPDPEQADTGRSLGEL